MSNVNLEDLVADVNGNNIISIDTETIVTLTGGKKNPFQGRVTKEMIGANVMIFSNKKTNGYENMVERRLAQEGKDPASFQLSPRKWGVRVENKPIVEHNDQKYLEVIFLRSGEVTYKVDGRPTAPELIEGLPERKEEAEQGGLERKVVIRTFNFDSVKGITIDKNHYDL